MESHQPHGRRFCWSVISQGLLPGLELGDARTSPFSPFLGGNTVQVYLITNKENGKLYVGETIQSLHNRWKGHKCDAKRYRGPLHLTHAFRKYGTEVFIIEPLHECESREEMDFVEIFYIAFLNTKAPLGYNLTDGGDGTKGTPVTEGQRRKISLSLTGRKASEKTKALLSKLRQGSSNSFFGKTHSPETLEKMRQAKLGKKQSPGHIAARVAWRNTKAAGA